jgi:hypothetical protein
MADLAEALSLAALVAATLEYAILIRHREARREDIRWQHEIQDSLMWARRIDPAPGRQWTDDGSRFRLVR